MQDKEKKSHIIVEGRSFVARHTHINDAELLFKWFNLPDFTLYRPQANHEDTQLENIRQRIFSRNQLSPRIEIELLLIDRLSHIPFGLSELTAIDRSNQKAEFSIGFAHGRGTRRSLEVLYGLFERIFNEMQLRKLIFHISQKNTWVISWMDKYCFNCEGIFKDELLIDNQGVDIHRYCLFKEQWQQSELRAKLEQVVLTEKNDH